jgi:hypothetical protein
MSGVMRRRRRSSLPWYALPVLVTMAGALGVVCALVFSDTLAGLVDWLL